MRLLARSKVIVWGGEASAILKGGFAAAKRPLVMAAAVSFFVNLLMLTGPIYMLQVYDHVLSSRSYETLAVLSVLMLVLFAALAALDFSRSALLARAGEAVESHLQETIFDRSLAAARQGMQRTDQPLADLRQIRSFLASPALTAAFDAPWAPLFIIIIFLLHWLLGLVALAGAAVILGLTVITDRLSRRASLDAQQYAGEAAAIARETFHNADAVHAMGMRTDLLGRWRMRAAQASDLALLSGDRIGGLSSATKAFRLFLQSSILGVGAFAAISGAITPGVMIAASIIAGRALAPLEIITAHWRNFIQTRDAVRRLNLFLAQTQNASPKTELPTPTGRLTVDRIVCRPGASQAPVLKGVSFSLQSGEALGVVGASAAGKSTLARAIIGAEPLLSGCVRIDDGDINHWTSSALGRHIGYMPQESELFAGTVWENISRMQENPDTDKIFAAAAAAGVHEMILHLQNGYDTQIGEEGAQLSAGQRQLIALARALYGEPPLVVLDEPNANLDARGEFLLATAIKRLQARGATTIIIAHRPLAIATVDKILWLVDGQVRAFGPRNEVFAKLEANRTGLLRDATERKG